jgi:hypothetical protein
LALAITNPKENENMPKTSQASNAHLLTEDLLTLKEATKAVPTPPGSKPLHFATLWRWTQRGLKGRKLETYRIGSRVVTSTQALHRFLEATQ